MLFASKKLTGSRTILKKLTGSAEPVKPPLTTALFFCNVGIFNLIQNLVKSRLRIMFKLRQFDTTLAEQIFEIYLYISQ